MARVARAEGFALTGDPTPEEASFVRAGIPSISLEPGPSGPGKAAKGVVGLRRRVSSARS